MPVTDRRVFIGMPELMHLDDFGRIVRDAFGVWPFLVGSCLTRKDFRDVDVRLVLDDDAFRKLGFAYDVAETGLRRCQRWRALCMAFSALGAQMTGLKVDFQIQSKTVADTQYPDDRSEVFGLIASPLDKRDMEIGAADEYWNANGPAVGAIDPNAAFDKVVEAARRLVECADEFGEDGGACGQCFEALIDATNETGD